MPTLLQIQTSFARSEDALAVARTLVTERLAACCQVLPGVTSVYSWDGQLHEAEEVLLLVKTTAEQWPALRDRVQALHPYDTPELIAMAVEHVSFEYLAWVKDSVR
jgi:periplasmic divalent cation tolerance protein